MNVSTSNALRRALHTKNKKIKIIKKKKKKKEKKEEETKFICLGCFI